MGADVYTWAGGFATLIVGTLIVATVAIVWTGRVLEKRLNRVIELLDRQTREEQE